MVDVLTREDVRDLTRIMAVEHVASLMQLMPERVGSPLSLNALREDIETSHTAVRNAVRAMELTYALFPIPPFSRKIARAVKKEKKGYFFDWGRCRDLSKRFENYVAPGRDDRPPSYRSSQGAGERALCPAHAGGEYFQKKSPWLIPHFGQPILLNREINGSPPALARTGGTPPSAVLAKPAWIWNALRRCSKRHP
jgi:hypothetical protein